MIIVVWFAVPVTLRSRRSLMRKSVGANHKLTEINRWIRKRFAFISTSSVSAFWQSPPKLCAITRSSAEFKTESYFKPQQSSGNRESWLWDRTDQSLSRIYSRSNNSLVNTGHPGQDRKETKCEYGPEYGSQVWCKVKSERSLTGHDKYSTTNIILWLLPEL